MQKVSEELAAELKSLYQEKKFSELIYNEVTRMISWDEEVWVESVTVYEHESNSATFNGKNAQVKNSQEKQQ